MTSWLFTLADVSTGHTSLIWGGFVVFILAMLLLDLLVFHKNAHEIKFKEAVGWSIFWVALGLAFSVVVYFEYDYRDGLEKQQTAAQTVSGSKPPTTPDAAIETAPNVTDERAIATAEIQPPTAAPAPAAAPSTPPAPKPKIDPLKPTSAWDAVAKYITGYLVEKALSVDNLFVILAIFSYFAIPPAYQHRVLFWGIIGALVFRAIFIFAGIALLTRFHWLIYVAGAFLVFTGLKMAFAGGNDDNTDLANNKAIKLVKKVLPVTPDFHGQKFFVVQAGKYVATPLFVALVVVEFTDVIFAVDSIPAILGITSDPFIVFTSNVFAILGLRALYFALAGFMKFFHYLKYGLAIILLFIGAKMVMIDLVKIPTIASLLITLGILAASVVISLIFPARPDDDDQQKEPAA